jgi:hypothetical protein
MVPCGNERRRNAMRGLVHAQRLAARHAHHSFVALALAGLLITAHSSYAQVATKVAGSFWADYTEPADAHGGPYTGSIDVSFECVGEPECNGTYQSLERYSRCSDIGLVGTVRLTALDLSQTGTIQGQITLGRFDYDYGDRMCVIDPGSFADVSLPYTATWDGSVGRISFAWPWDDGITARFNGSFKADQSAPPPVFPMTVQASFDTTANVSAQMQFRPQDVGTAGSVFVFAVAPATLVTSGLKKVAHFGHMAKGSKEDPVQCVLAQLSSTGQLTGVSASTMQAYVTGVLSSAGQAVTIMSGVLTANVAGATFYVGYGTSAQSMLDNGLNRSAATAPGSLQCKPEPPQKGWWWNTAEGGRGYSVEVRGHNIFFAAFHYDVSGRSTWHVATGPTSLDGSLYTGELLAAAGGQTLGGAYPGFPSISTVGPLTLAFANATQGTMIWPGGTVAIERFNIVPNGLQAQPKANQPESGWWWNPEESGRGFFLEWQDGWVDIAGYMYDEEGNPVWYLGVYETPEIRAISGNWWRYGNGQTMGGQYKPATRLSDNVAPVTVTFSGPETAIMTLPNGRTTRLQRHRF